MTETERRTKNSRHIIIIKKGLQYRYMALMAASVMAGFLIIAMEVGWSLSSIYKEHPALLSPLFTQLGVLLPAFLLKMLIYFAIVLLVAGVVSHRMAGPIYKFEKSAAVLGGGDLTHRIFLRNGDQLLELQEALNDMTASLQDRVKADRQKAERLAADISALAAQEKDPALREKLAALEARAKTITSEFNV